MSDRTLPAATADGRTVRRVRYAVTMLTVAAASLLLLMYIGHGEAQRNYFKFILDGVVAQGRLVQTPIESHLRSGLPLRQYAGFTTLAKRIADADEAILAIFVTDGAGRIVFAGSAENPAILPPSASLSGGANDVDVRQSNRFYQVILPLRDKFEIAGNLVVIVPRAVVSARVANGFRPLVFVALALSLLFTTFVSLIGPRLRSRRAASLPIAYSVMFLGMSAAVVATLISLYSEGVQLKTRALADSLAQRLQDIVAFNLNFDQFDGFQRMFEEYRKLNPEISAAALKIGGQIQIHTSPEMAGKRWVHDGATYEYHVALSHPQRGTSKIEVVVALPTAIVYDQVLLTIKNFAALFVASALLALLLLQLAGIMQNFETSAERPAQAPRGVAALDPVKPIFFMAVFLEHLSYPFLPQFALEVTLRSGLSPGFVSAPFIAYYLCFAVALIPAGHFSNLYGPRRLMFTGLLCAALGIIGLVLAQDFGAMLLARAIAGIGQGMLFIGVQSYILDTATDDRRTRGAAIIVFGFQGGMIAGTAIGSLLVGYLGMSGVMLLAGTIAIVMAVYARGFIPQLSPLVGKSFGGLEAWRSLGRDLARLLPNAEFLRTMVLIGVPTKAVMTGVVIFALPLIMSRMGYAAESIGQVIMLYAIGVLLASNYSARYVDRTRRTETALFWGTAAAGVALLLVGLMEWQAIAAIGFGSTLLLVVGVLVLGLAHGLICAPVVTRIAECRIAAAIGANSAVATYRFLERIGHVAGPIIVGQLLLLAGHSPAVVAWIGAMIIALGLIYLARYQSAPVNSALGGG